MNTIKGICYIIAACKDNFTKFNLSTNESDFVIAADGGYDLLKDMSVIPDILIGDLDSIGEVPDNIDIIKFPSEKDDTDTFLAYKLGYEKGYRTFVIFGGIGGRIDHTLANIKTIETISDNNGRGFLIGNNTILTSICDCIEFPKGCEGYISVFSNRTISNGVTIKGLKYTISNTDFSSSTTLGTSNEFIGKRAEISVTNGNLLITWNQDTDSFIKNINTYLNKKEL